VEFCRTLRCGSQKQCIEWAEIFRSYLRYAEDFGMDEKLTVPMPRELVEFVRRQAVEQDRSAASVVRRLIEAEARRAGRSARAAARDAMKEQAA
jgi:hypothetical protein